MSRLIWVCSVCKSYKRRLYEVKVDEQPDLGLLCLQKLLKASV